MGKKKFSLKVIGRDVFIQSMFIEQLLCPSALDAMSIIINKRMQSLLKFTIKK